MNDSVLAARPEPGFWFKDVERFPEGVTWPNGEPLLCVVCTTTGPLHRERAVVTASLRNNDPRFEAPVAYCPAHTPPEIYDRFIR